MAFPPPSLATCSSSDLYQWLWKHRFDQSAPAVQSFLQEALDSSNNNKESTASASDAANARLLEKKNPLKQDAFTVSMIQPARSKMQLSFRDNGMELVDKNDNRLTMTAGSSSISHLIVYPKPHDCQVIKDNDNKVTTTDSVLIVLKKDSSNNSCLHFKNKPVQQICFSLPTDFPLYKTDAPDASDYHQPAQHSSRWTLLLQQCLGLNTDKDNCTILRFHKEPFDDHHFVSAHDDTNQHSTTHSAMPFVHCTLGVKEGALYPSREGLLFLAPAPLWIPVAHIAQCEWSRSTERYVELIVTVTNDENEESRKQQQQHSFTYIRQAEFEGLNQFLTTYIMSRGDEDNTTEGIVDNEEPLPSTNGGPRGKRRRASLQAQATNKRAVQQLVGDDDDDDEEDVTFHAGTDHMDDEEGNDEEEDDGDDEEDDEDEDGEILDDEDDDEALEAEVLDDEDLDG